MEQRREYIQKYYQKHRKELLAYKREYRQEHKEEIVAYKKEYRKTHREQCNAYQKKICKQRRDEYVKGKFCPYCGGTKNLVIHHVYPDTKDPILKGHGGAIWTWCEERRIMELLFCEIVCKSCHGKIHAGMINNIKGG